jgi:hypothetical protein
MKNEPKDEKTRRVPMKKFESNNIFSKENKNDNSGIIYNQSRKSNNTKRNAFNTTYQENNLFEGRKCKKPENIRNMFQSQLNL